MTPDASPHGLLIEPRDLDRMMTAAFIAAVGVMLALCIAALFWAPPGPISGSHAIILDSMLGAQRVEPREKAFFALAVTIGFSMGLAALAFQRPWITFSWRTLIMLALVVVSFNVCCSHALNKLSGAWWAFAGLGIVLLLAWMATRASR